jgi:2-polyprenyl-3-methyl-5-hydroxy-6-metoxy-1,4-benzoquinol methylase
LYWQERYEKGRTSGAGSYGRLAEFKAEVINNFIEKESILTVVEWGSGDGNQLSYLSCEFYTGLDISPKVIDICKKKYKGDAKKTFHVIDNALVLENKFDLSLSLDVIYHLIEDNVFEEYVNKLFSSSCRFVCIYSSNYNEPQAGHVKHRNFTEYIENNIKDFKLIQMIKNKYPYDRKNPDETSFADFFFYQKENLR